MKRHLVFSLTLAFLVSPVWAQDNVNDNCQWDPSSIECLNSNVRDPDPSIYPAKPFAISYIHERVSALTEGHRYINDIHEMEGQGLNIGTTKSQPWGGPYWALNQGMIANNYQDKDYKFFVFSMEEMLRWQKNVNDFKKRKDKIHPIVNELDESDLAKLAPSEKYDLLLGDKSFDLTNRIWQYAEKWGNEKKWGFLSYINLPDGYRVPEANKMMALWEGICHGWAVAAGHSPRPEKTVWVTLPNGKKMPFYPNDIKALVSLMWANSTIQSNVIFEGNRCNNKSPYVDSYGRYIDTKIDKDDSTLVPRCSDVHPAIFHMATVNILGVEGRSFVVDKDAKAPIANQPVSSYELEYFNPRTGKAGPLSESLLSVQAYGRKDPFRAYRNKETASIVGVSMVLKYVDWEYPKKEETNGPENDSIKEMKFNYDLEINSAGKIVGGQWRVGKTPYSITFKNGTGQPDFFWVVPRDWKNYFRAAPGLPTWDFNSSTVPPKEYLGAAHTAHSFVYEESKRFFGASPQCPVFPEGGGAPIKVDCSFRYPKPQPLIQVVDKLLEMSRNQ